MSCQLNKVKPDSLRCVPGDLVHLFVVPLLGHLSLQLHQVGAVELDQQLSAVKALKKVKLGDFALCSMSIMSYIYYGLT